MSKSCKDCPSFVKADETQAVLGRDVGADVCFRHAHILSRSMLTQGETDQIAERFAESCADFAAPRPAQGATLASVPVAVPVAVGTQNLEPPATCTGCSHFVKNNVVRRELGWNLAMCAAKGRLLFPGAYTSEAINCGVGDRGVDRDTTDGVVLYPQYSGGGMAAVSTGGAAPRATATFDPEAETARHSVDPREYETDRPVTPEESARFVRAWRRVISPEPGMPEIFMPIFDGTKLCGYDPRESYGGHRPDLYVDHQFLLYDLAVEMIELDETPVLVGSAGTGKTELGAYLAYMMDLPFTRISIDKGTERWHLLGESTLVVDPASGQAVTKFNKGRLADKLDKPGVIMIDEPNLKNDIFETIRPIFDNAKQLMLDEDQGTSVERGMYTFIMCSQNPSWDPIYVGAEPMSGADMDRTTQFFFELPEPAVERQIIKAHCADIDYEIPAMTLDKIMQIASDIRQLIQDGTLMMAWGLRAQIKVAKKTQYYSLEKAYRRAVLDGLPEDEVEAVLSVVRSIA